MYKDQETGEYQLENGQWIDDINDYYEYELSQSDMARQDFDNNTDLTEFIGC